MTATAANLQLAEGRALCYAEFGDPAGAPVVLAHGFPGSRLDAQVVHDAAARAHVRLVCADRPGFGGSDLSLTRSLTDWPADIAEVADALGIDRFAVAGFSAGGPYALACAAALPGRVAACGLVSSPMPLDRPGSTEGMSTGNRLLFGLGRRVPPAAAGLVRLLARSTRTEPARLVRRMARGMPEADRSILADPAVGPAYASSWIEGFSRGAAGGIHELKLLTRPWPFSLEQVSVPTTVWHGSDDKNVPVRHAYHLAESLPDCRLQVVERAGHLLFLQQAESILSALRNEVGG